ncbi:DUF3040 domain-containing protein [Paenarthrobacter sp. RAF54_2]|uniref:DUF3040 domain-containing protein n=1 Tax=unclassified Paenarthrobacter TaxID=2634190 RepID=UPI003F96788D
MHLNERERRVLQQLERELFIQDPDLARQLETGIPARRPYEPQARHVFGVALGVLLMLLAIPISPSPLGYCGFLLMAWGLVAHHIHKSRYIPG